MDVEEVIWPIIRMMNGDGSMRESDYGNIIDSLRGQRDEITQLRAELEQERELADRLADAGDVLIKNLLEGDFISITRERGWEAAHQAHAARRNK